MVWQTQCIRITQSMRRCKAWSWPQSGSDDQGRQPGLGSKRQIPVIAREQPAGAPQCHRRCAAVTHLPQQLRRLAASRASTGLQVARALKHPAVVVGDGGMRELLPISRSAIFGCNRRSSRAGTGSVALRVAIGPGPAARRLDRHAGRQQRLSSPACHRPASVSKYVVLRSI